MRRNICFLALSVVLGFVIGLCFGRRLAIPSRPRLDIHGLDSGNREVREEAKQRILSLGREVIPELTAVAESDIHSQTVRIEAAELLDELGAVQALKDKYRIGYFVSRLGTGYQPRRVEASPYTECEGPRPGRELARMGEAALPALVKVLESTNYTAVAQAAVIIGHVYSERTKELIPTFNGFLDHSRFGLRYGAWCALNRLVPAFKRFGYAPHHSEEQRRPVVETWRTWWAEHGDECRWDVSGAFLASDSLSSSELDKTQYRTVEEFEKPQPKGTSLRAGDATTSTGAPPKSEEKTNKPDRERKAAPKQGKAGN